MSLRQIHAAMTQAYRTLAEANMAYSASMLRRANQLEDESPTVATIYRHMALTYGTTATTFYRNERANQIRTEALS